MKTPPKSRLSDDKVGLVVGGGIALLVVVGIFVAGLVLFVTEFRSAHTWLTTDGTVTGATLAQFQKRVSNSSTRTREHYRPEIAYSYRVGDTVRTGTRIRLYSRSSTNKASMEAILARYPVGSAVVVHYDPSDPSDSLLEPGISWFSLTFLLLGGAGTAGAAMVVRLIVRRRQTTAPA